MLKKLNQKHQGEREIMSIERYNDQTAEAFVRARIGGQDFIVAYDVCTYDKVNYKVGEDLEAIDFLNNQVEKYSNNHAGRVCTCDGNNEALRAYQVAYDDCYDLMHNWGDYMAYVSSSYSDREHYRIVWDSDDCHSADVGLDDLCARLGMAEVGTRSSFYNDYHYLKEAIQALSESDDDDDEYDYYWQTTANQILSKYLNKFIQSALKEQYKEL